jgi:hypothetical protein
MASPLLRYVNVGKGTWGGGGPSEEGRALIEIPPSHLNCYVLGAHHSISL